MLRFIYVCMGVVALSVLSIAGQSVFTGIDDSYQSVLQRNEAAPVQIAAQPAPQAVEPVSVSAIESPDMSAEDLNAIDTAAGGAGDEFGAPFADRAPAALAEPAASALIAPEPSGAF